MATTTAIASGTAAATAAADITVDSGSSIQVWTDVGLGSDERVDVYRVDSGDTVEVRLTDGKVAVSLSSDIPAVMLNGPAIFRLKKTATASATAVLYDS